jgi:hypothetical protein
MLEILDKGIEIYVVKLVNNFLNFFSSIHEQQYLFWV